MSYGVFSHVYISFNYSYLLWYHLQAWPKHCPTYDLLLYKIWVPTLIYVKFGGDRSYDL